MAAGAAAPAAAVVVAAAAAETPTVGGAATGAVARVASAWVGVVVPVVASAAAAKGAGVASPAVFERKCLGWDPGPDAGRREDDAPGVALSSEVARPSEAAVARAMSAARKGSSASLTAATVGAMGEFKVGTCRVWGSLLAFAFALPLPALVVLALRALVTVAGAAPARGGNSSREISSTDGAGDVHAGWGVGVTSPAEHVGRLAGRGGGGSKIVIVHVAVFGRGGGRGTSRGGTHNSHWGETRRREVDAVEWKWGGEFLFVLQGLSRTHVVAQDFGMQTKRARSRQPAWGEASWYGERRGGQWFVVVDDEGTMCGRCGRGENKEGERRHVMTCFLTCCASKRSPEWRGVAQRVEEPLVVLASDAVPPEATLSVGRSTSEGTRWLREVSDIFSIPYTGFGARSRDGWRSGARCTNGILGVKRGLRIHTRLRRPAGVAFIVQRACAPFPAAWEIRPSWWFGTRGPPVLINPNFTIIAKRSGQRVMLRIGGKLLEATDRALRIFSAARRHIR
ncbi:hypothetical protein K438DRAFT_2154046 [Mycena galopus ATCC 62051]|nr:hypothetical protein K438DRAFT_2154046 [Mycena galopus ATCC 62051]